MYENYFVAMMSRISGIVWVVLLVCYANVNVNVNANANANTNANTNANSKIIILRCCPPGKSLIANSCENYDTAKWAPVVYSPERRGLLPPGTIPDNFEFVDAAPECVKGSYFLDNNNAVLTEDNGSLFANELILEPSTFCISPTGLIGCLTSEHLDKKKTEKKVRKCCSTGQVYSEEKAACVQNQTNFLSEDTYIHTGFPRCESTEYAVIGQLGNKYSLNMDGTLNVANGAPISEYCVEYIVGQTYNHTNQTEASVFTCSYPATKPDADDIRYILYPLGFFLSCFFLAITLISSFMLPSSYHALHWKCQTHYVACLLVGDLLLAITQLASNTMKHNFMLCTGIATAVHFSFLAAFFWLNTMCFNIWWTFRDLRPTSLDKGQETYRLVLYEMYAWGGPLLIASMGVIMDQLKEQYPYLLTPNFGHNSCWFRGPMEKFVYFFGPVGLLLLVNLVLFAATTRELTCGLWKREVVKSTTERTALSHICMKLVIVMGITWILDVLSWMIGGHAYLWYLSDLVNALQGVFIFIVVGCQPQVWSAVKRMWCLSDSPSRNAGRSYSSNATPSIINDQSSTKPVETLC